MIRYDASIIRQFAENLYSQADLTVAIFTIGAMLAGGGIGYLVFSSGAAFVMAIVFGGIGYLIGQSRASQLRLQAQVALCQVQIEENTARFLQALATNGIAATQNVIGSSQPTFGVNPQVATSANSVIATAKPSAKSGRRCRDCGADLPRGVVDFCPRCSAPVVG